jgi:hypothetical protein
LECGPVTAFYLNEIKDPAMQQDLLENVVSLRSNISKTILLFMSPQALQNHSCWQFLVKELITRGLLRFVDVDDNYLFLHFGMTCHLKFSSLKELLFQHLLADATTGKHPYSFLLMMATCSINTITYLELLSGLTIGDTTLNCHWPESYSMQHRHFFCVKYFPTLKLTFPFS